MAPQARLSAALLAAALAGCGDTPAGEAVRLVTRPAAAPATQAPAAISGPALLLLAPRQTVLRPVHGTGGRVLWRGEDGIAVATEGVRVVATAGLGQMLMATRFDTPDPLEDPRALLATPARARRQVDLSGADRDPASMRFGLVVECELGARQEAEWLVVEERCVAGEHAFTNRFWVPAAGSGVVRSEQWVGDAADGVVVQSRGP
jgi:hypothetical protein